MRILFVLHTFPPESWGGTELHVQGMARVLSESHDVRIFCRQGNPQLAHGDIDRGFQEGILVTRFNNLYEDFESFESTWRHEASHQAFVDELDAFQADVVHVHHLTGLSATILEAVKRRNLPLVFSLHDFWTICPRGQRLHPDDSICESIDRSRCHSCLKGLWPGWFEDLPEGAKESPILAPWDQEMTRLMGLCDVLLTPSAFHRDRMIEATGIDARQFVALAHGLDHDMFPAPKDPTPKPRVIGYIGSVIPTKGVHLLVEAFGRLEGDFELEIWGHAPRWHEKGDYLAELKAMVQEPGRVRFMGHYENQAVPEILSGLDILVVPSLWWETFSLTIREAMLAGVPVVASDLGAMREALMNSGAGLVFDHTSPGALARSIRRLVDDEDLRRRCASQRLQVKTLQQNAADYLHLYEQAAIYAAERRDVIEVSESSFPRRKSKRGSQKAPKDLRVSIEKVGGGDVKVQSAVKRGDRTQVSFVFDYGPSDESSEVHVTVDFSKEESVAPEAAKPAQEESLPEIPREASSATASAATSQSESAQKKAHEESMFKMDKDSFPKQVKALDDMVDVSHLDEKDQVIESKPRRDSRDRRDDRGPRDQRPRRDREENRDGGRERRPRRDSRRDGDDSRRREERPRRERNDRGDRNDRGGRGRGRDERPRRRDQDDRDQDDRERRPRREEKPQQKPASPKADKKEEAKPKELTHEKGDVVWNGEAGWKLPESSAPAPRTKPERAPNHRTGKQPGVKSNTDDSGFGDGV